MSPTLKTLLRNEDYKRYFLRQPVLPKKLFHPMPWKVWGLKTDNKWAGRAVATFPEAFEMTKKMLRMPQFQDAAICSRVIGFKPPGNLQDHYRAEGYDWCLMCRRPVHFVTKRRHHALRDDLHRYYAAYPVCPYCGIREETLLNNRVTLGKC